MTEEQDVERIAQAFRKVLSEPEDGISDSQRAILVKRIPIICNDILEMKGDMKWIKWLVMGVAGAIGVLAITYLTRGG